MTQLDLPLRPRVTADPAALSGRRGHLRLGDPIEGPDGSITVLWKRGAAARWKTDDRFAAWTVEPVPAGCPAYERGWRWFYSARTSCTESASSGGMPGTRDDAILHAQHLLLRLELGQVKYRLVGKLLDLELAERNAGAPGLASAWRARRRSAA